MRTKAVPVLIIVSLIQIATGRPASLTSTVPPEWSAGVAAEIDRAEYQFSPSDQMSWSAPNRAHDLRVRIDTDGIEIVSRSRGEHEEDGGWRIRLDLAAVGRGPEMGPAGDAALSALTNRAELRRGDLSEWYVNDDKGLEQGFTIERSPGDRDSGSPLVLELRMQGGLRAYADGEGQSILLKTAAGVAVLRYGGLAVRDARGAMVPARLAVAPGRVRILISDRDATYPLEVDPVMTSPTWTADGGELGAQFGYSVTTAGDVNGDGYSDVIVGSWLYDNGQGDEGRAYLYLGSASGLRATPSWMAEGNLPSVWFGYVVGTAGDVNRDGYSDVLVGSPNYTNGQASEGRVFLYLGSAAGLGATPAWTSECNQTGAQLGRGASTAGDVNGDGYSDVIVGAPSYGNGQSGEGRAYLYLGSASGLGASPVWTAESDQLSAAFGNSVSTAGDVNGDGYDDVLVGALLYDNGQTDEGRAFLFLGRASGLGASPAWTAESDQTGARFGDRVTTAGDVNADGYSDVLVGAPFYGGGQLSEGRAFLYLGGTSGLATSPAWIAESDQAGGRSGIVNTAGDINGDGYSDVIVGAFLYDNGESDEGRASVYTGSASGLATVPAWITEGNQPGANLGTSVGTAGDVDGDGYDDVIIGAAKYSNSLTEEGRALVYLGAPSCGAATPAGSPTLSFSLAGDQLSWSSLVGATWYDIVRGDVRTLISSGGDFTAATLGCLANDQITNSVSYTGVPGPGQAFWFLVRGANCGGRGTYDSGVASQVGSRDSEINASVPACP